ncbi:D-alanine--D-alanine ligase [Clostridia bacterium]|nr:D-alanine--D-alanine ligase [Clostridia bacterium]
MAKIQLAVIFGGRACEHDVSVITAVQAMSAADKNKYDIIPLYICKDGEWYTGEPLFDIKTFEHFSSKIDGVERVLPDITANNGFIFDYPKQKLFAKPRTLAKIDVAMPIFHGMNGEDGTVQGMLELMNVPYTSAGLVGSSVGMDKIAQKMLYKGCGFPILDFLWYTRDAWRGNPDRILDEITEKLGTEIFAKPANLGSSIGITKATSRETLREAMAVAFSYDRRVIVEPAVNKPLEINCSVLGFGDSVESSPCEAPVSWQEFLTFDEKYLASSGNKSSGGMANLRRQIPAPISDDMTKRIQTLSLDIFGALDCKGVVRIDYMITPATNELFVNEINTIPGSLSFYLWEAKGVPFVKLIDRMVEAALDAHKQKNESSFAFESPIIKQFGGVKGKSSGKSGGGKTGGQAGLLKGGA